MSRKKNLTSLAHPRYWATWMAVAWLRGLAWMPYRWLLRSGPVLGRCYAWLMPRRREIARINLEICFPEKSAQWRENLLLRQFDNLGRSLLEVPIAWWGSPARLRPLTHVHGMEHLHAAAQRGKGVLLLSAHFNSPEIGGRMLCHLIPFWAMYRPSNNPVMDRVISRARRRWLAGIIARDDVRQVIRRLKQGEIIWYAVDQNTSRRESVFADFFGTPASTNAATARLAKITGAAVVPFKSIRREDGSGHDLYLEPAWDNFPSGDLMADTQRVNDLVEDWVRQTPQQYMWIHRRFRTRPNRSDPKLYPVSK